MPSEAAATIAVIGAGASHPGRVRARNEDRFHVDLARGIFIVVDGVGGQPGGERAAEIAIDAVRTRLERNTGSIVERLREAVAGANEAIHDESGVRPDLSGMACVLTAAVVSGGRVYAGHVGDTRLYKLRGGAMVKLTHDHSPVGALEDDGRLDEREAMAHPRRNEVWRDVGTTMRRPAEPEFIEIVDEVFEPDAALLLCSDGLTDSVSSADVASIIQARAGAPAVAVQDLIWAANDAGGRDNITAIVAEGPAFARSTPEVRIAGRSRHLLAMIGRYALVFALGVAATVAARVPIERFLAPPATTTDAPVVASQTRTWRVGTGAGADATSINTAIAEARPGDLVVVEPGTYRESITLREGITVISAQRHGAELRRPAQLTGPWTAVVASGITSTAVRGFRIVGTKTEKLDIGVLLSDSVVSLEDLEIAGAQDAAVRIVGSSVILNADAEPVKTPKP